MEGAKETEFGTRVAWGVRMMPERRVHAQHAHSTEKLHDTKLDDET